MQCWYFGLFFVSGFGFVFVSVSVWFLFCFVLCFFSGNFFGNSGNFGDFGNFGNIPESTAGCTHHSAKTREFSLGARARDLRVAVAPPPVVGLAKLPRG